MNLAIVRGYLTRDPELRELPSGTCVANYDVSVRDVSPAESVPVAWHDPPPTWAAMEAGDEVVVTGRIRRRFFRAGNGTASRTELIADRVVPARHAKRVRALLEKVASTVEAASA